MLISSHDSTLSYCYDENYFVTLPVNYSDEMLTTYKDLKKFPYNEFSSKTKIMNKQEIAEMLNKGNFI